jgi:hypothetical protein
MGYQTPASDDGFAIGAQETRAGVQLSVCEPHRGEVDMVNPLAQGTLGKKDLLVVKLNLEGEAFLLVCGARLPFQEFGDQLSEVNRQFEKMQEVFWDDFRLISNPNHLLKLRRQAMDCGTGKSSR